MQTRAQLHGETIRSPQRFPCFAQTSFIFGRIARMVQTLGHGGDFAGQWPKHVEVWYILTKRNLSRAQGAHPKRRSRNRTRDTPADNQQRDKNDKENLGEDTKERPAPHQKDLRADVAHVVYHGQVTQYIVSPMNRQRENVNRHLPQSRKRTFFPVLRDRLRYRRQSGGERSGKFRSNGDRCALPVVDNDSQQMFAVCELLHKLLQFLV